MNKVLNKTGSEPIPNGDKSNDCPLFQRGLDLLCVSGRTLFSYTGTYHKGALLSFQTTPYPYYLILDHVNS